MLAVEGLDENTTEAALVDNIMVAVKDLKTSKETIEAEYENLTTGVKDLAGSLGVGGFAGIMMNFMSVEDILAETVSIVNVMKPKE